MYVLAGLTQPLFEVTQTDIDFKALYPSVFQGLGKLKEPYHIELEQRAIPYALSTPQRVPRPLREGA